MLDRYDFYNSLLCAKSSQMMRKILAAEALPLTQNAHVLTILSQDLCTALTTRRLNARRMTFTGSGYEPQNRN
jgi:hypothetical protein